MLRVVWLCVLTLALPCWTYPSGHNTTCDEFGRGVNFDPMNAVGEWFTVYSIGDRRSNFTEKTTIRELTSSELQENDQMLKNYAKDKSKLQMTINVLHPYVHDTYIVMVANEDTGNVEGWVTSFQTASTDFPIHDLIHIILPTVRTFKWKSVDGFLVVMMCDLRRVYVLSKTATPDEDKLQSAVDSLHMEGYNGQRVYPNLSNL